MIGRAGSKPATCLMQKHTFLQRINDPDVTPTHEHAPEDPRDVHDSHAWVLQDRWGECSICGARDYWPAGGSACPRVPRTERSEPVPLTEALATLRADLERFAEWWISKGLGAARPSLTEWFAEFTEWRRVPRASY